MWGGAELLEKHEENNRCKVKVKLLRNNTPNDLLQAVLPSSKIISFNEVIPSMNDIFISKVSEVNPNQVPVNVNMTE